MKKILLFALGSIVMVFTAHASSAQGGNSPAMKSISEYFQDNHLIIRRQAFYSADKTQRVEYFCEDENLPGGANEGASNPANVHCMAALFLNKAEKGMFNFLTQSEKWIFSDAIDLHYGSVKRFAGHRLIIEMLEYSNEDALCCPSERSTQIFNTASGKLVEDLTSKRKALIVTAIKDGADQKRIGELISQGNDVNAKDKYGNTALMITAENGNVETAKLLIDHNAEVNAVRNNGKTALIIAAENGSYEMVKLLLEKAANIDAKDKTGRSALDFAIWYDKADISRLLIEKGADVNIKNERGETPLMGAALYGREDIFQLLVNKGADINARSRDNAAVLLYATGSHQNCKIVRFLLDKGADANERFSGDTLLMRAAGSSSDDTDCMQALLEKGVEINAQNIIGWTALFSAASAGNIGNVEFLIRNGADPDLRASMGETALSTARNMRRQKVVQFLESRKAH